jgi:hypothetical protein
VAGRFENVCAPDATPRIAFPLFSKFHSRSLEQNQLLAGGLSINSLFPNRAHTDNAHLYMSYKIDISRKSRAVYILRMERRFLSAISECFAACQLAAFSRTLPSMKAEIDCKL